MWLPWEIERLRAWADAQDEPCPYSGQAAAVEEAPEAPEAEDDVPPCHRR